MKGYALWVALEALFNLGAYVLSGLFLLRLWMESRYSGFELSPAGAILRRSARPDKWDDGGLDVLVDEAPGSNGQVPRRGERYPSDYGSLVNTGGAMPPDGTHDGVGGRPSGPGAGYAPPPGWRGCMPGC